MKDDDFIELSEFVLEMAEVDFYISEHFLDQEITLRPEKVERGTPDQLIVEIVETHEVRIGASPRMYYVETTFLPFFHNIKLNREILE